VTGSSGWGPGTSLKERGGKRRWGGGKFASIWGQCGGEGGEGSRTGKRRKEKNRSKKRKKTPGGMSVKGKPAI